MRAAPVMLLVLGVGCGYCAVGGRLLVWCLVAGAGLLSWGLLISKAAIGEKSILVDAFQALSYTLLAVWFYVIPEWNKPHLPWVVPLSSGLPVFFAITRDSPRR